MAIPIVLPQYGQSEENCVLTRWHVKKGDVVKDAQPVAEIETDKAIFDLESPHSGTILALFFEEGEEIPVLTNIAAVGNIGDEIEDLRPGKEPSTNPKQEEGTARENRKKEDPRAQARRSTPQPDKSIQVRISPRAKKLAQSQGLNLSELNGSGPRGRITVQDVEEFLSSKKRKPKNKKQAFQKGNLQIIKLRGVRKITAERMKVSLTSSAQYTLHTNFDATELLQARKTLSEKGSNAEGISLTDMIAYSVSRILQGHPTLNAHIDGDQIITYGDINLGIAVDTPRGLLVPVVPSAQNRSLVDLSQTTASLVEQCQSGEISPDSLSNGTFTVSNMGMLGIDTFTPILNPPQVGILGVGRIYVKAVRRDEKTEFVDSIRLSLTVDHQAVDGAPAASFLQELVNFMERFGHKVVE